MTILFSFLAILAVLGLMVTTGLILFGIISLPSVPSVGLGKWPWASIGKWILVAIVAIVAIIYLVPLVREWWQSSETATVPAQPDPYDWELVMYKQGELTGPRCQTKIVSMTANRLAFEYKYGRGIGRIRLTSTNGQDWSGSWETSAADGIVSLKMNPERDSLRGRWSDPDCSSEVDRKGGEIHLMKVR